MKKQVWLRFMALLGVGLLLAACGKEEVPAPETTPTPVASETKSAAQSETEVKPGSFEELAAKAQAGDAQAQLKLAEFYESIGRYKTAVTWYEYLLKRGDVTAQRALAALYEEGNGVEQSYQKAFDLYNKAAEKNDIEAKLALVNYYSTGIVIAQDTKKADELYQQAYDLAEKEANAGNVNAQRVFGELLIETNKSEEIEKGLVWLEKAASTGNARAQTSLGWALLKEDVKNKLPDTVKAASWFEKAAKQGNISALLALGDIYPRMGVTKENLDKMLLVYGRAANAGSADAQLELASVYLDGVYAKDNLIAIDETKGVEWLVKAAEQGNEDAVERLVELYQNGQGSIQKDPEQALKWSKIQQEKMEALIKKKEQQASQEK